MMPENSMIFQPAESDTVFRIAGCTLTPLYSFVVEKPRQNGESTTGTWATFVFTDNEQMLIAKSGYELISTPSSASIATTSVEYFSFDLKRNKLEKIEKFNLDFENLELVLPFVSFPYKNRVRYVYQAIELKKIIDEALKRDNLSQDARENLVKLNSEISENDNPILISGNWR